MHNISRSLNNRQEKANYKLWFVHQKKKKKSNFPEKKKKKPNSHKNVFYE